jgi:DNA-binding response OmpR family regulator
VKVAMHKLRKKLREHGIELSVIRGVGYYLDDENKAKVEMLVGEK